MSARMDGESEAKRAAFDALAPRWDDLKPEEAVVAGFDRGLALLGDLSGLRVVDLGCGTGRLEAHLLPRLASGGVVAVDFSPGMIARASLKCPSPRVTWLCRDVVDTGLSSSSADLVLCFNSFPHFPDGGAVLHEAARWLRPGGRLLLWHDLGRERLAEVHRRAGPPVHADVLPPIGQLAQLAGNAGFDVGMAEEDDSSYTLLARRPR